MKTEQSEKARHALRAEFKPSELDARRTSTGITDKRWPYLEWLERLLIASRAEVKELRERLDKIADGGSH